LPPPTACTACSTPTPTAASTPQSTTASSASRSSLAGIEGHEEVVRTLVAAGPDAIQLSVGLAPLLQSQPGRDKPALVLRSDVANVYGPEPPSEPFSVVVDDAVGHWERASGQAAEGIRTLDLLHGKQTL
jgi:hypothetical protein